MDKKLPPLSSLKPFDLHHFTFTFFLRNSLKPFDLHHFTFTYFLRNSLQSGFWIGPTYPNPSPIYSTTLTGANKKAYMSLFRWKKGSKKNWAIPESSRNSGTERKCSFGVFWKGELNWSCANFNFLSYQYFFANTGHIFSILACENYPEKYLQYYTSQTRFIWFGYKCAYLQATEETDLPINMFPSLENMRT